MKITPDMEKEFEKSKANATTPYGLVIYDVAEHWADLMESVLDPKSLEESSMAAVAKATYRDADTEGLTGLMYNFAAEILCRYWVYGKALDQALAWATANRIENIDYKTELQRLETRVLKVPQKKAVEVPV